MDSCLDIDIIKNITRKSKPIDDYSISLKPFFDTSLVTEDVVNYAFSELILPYLTLKIFTNIKEDEIENEIESFSFILYTNNILIGEARAPIEKIDFLSFEF